MNNSSGIILVGGRSRRLGTDKSQLTVNGMTLLEHNVTLLASVVERIVLVTNGELSYKNELSAFEEIEDTYPNCGPLGGIITGLEAVGEGWHCVIACDMPSIQQTMLELLFSKGSGDYDVVVPFFNGQYQPLCAAYSLSAISSLRKFFNDGGRAIHLALEQLRVLKLTEDELRQVDPELTSFVNINTPGDWEAWQTSRSNKH